VIEPNSADTIITLGDHINRGPNSKGVIEQLLALRERSCLISLLGNHEEMLLATLEGKGDFRYFLQFGGDETLVSYGVRDVEDIPAEHLQFIKSCRLIYETASHFFVHAYYEPNAPLNQQPWNTLIWASLPEQPQRHCSGKTAIVGHTAQEYGSILDLGFLKCIDTFCHGGGWLTALEIKSGQCWQADLAGRVRSRVSLPSAKEIEARRR
ncbi:MAG: metallophosphoesterase, partial [Gemmataceae bacterium]